MFESFVSLLESATLSFIPYGKRVLTAGLSYILYLFLFNIAVVSAMHDYFSLIHATMPSERIEASSRIIALLSQHM